MEHTMGGLAGEIEPKEAINIATTPVGGSLIVAFTVLLVMGILNFISIKRKKKNAARHNPPRLL